MGSEIGFLLTLLTGFVMTELKASGFTSNEAQKNKTFSKRQRTSGEVSTIITINWVLNGHT